jgi:hypothetical protein
MVIASDDLVSLAQQLIDFYQTGNPHALAIDDVTYELLSILVKPSSDSTQGNLWPIKWVESTRIVKAQVKRWQEIF